MEETDIQKTLSNFKPETCVFVLSIDQNNQPSGMVAGWQTRCSGDPPLFAVSLSKKRNTHFNDVSPPVSPGIKFNRIRVNETKDINIARFFSGHE